MDEKIKYGRNIFTKLLNTKVWNSICEPILTKANQIGHENSDF